MALSSQAVTLTLGIAVGLGVGLGGYTFVYAKGGSYLSNDPAACANCHVMREHFEGWSRSSHRSVAACNDCHTPPGFFAKYATKASNGFWHSFAFTTGDFPDPIGIKPHNREVADSACRGCHGPIVEAMAMGTSHDGATSCIRCHGAPGHPTFTAPTPHTTRR